MNPKERVATALQHREPDRVPVGEMGIDSRVVEEILGHPTYYRSKAKERNAIWAGKRDEVVASQKEDLVALVRRLEWDFVPVFLTYQANTNYAPRRRIDDKTWEDAQGNLWKSSDELGDAICVRSHTVTREEISQLVEKPLAVDESALELVRFVVKELGRTHFIIGRGWHSPPSWTDGTFILPGEGLAMSIEDFSFMMVEQPEFLDDVLRAYTKRAIEYGLALINAGVDAVQVNADYCHNSGPWMSPAAFRQHVLPRLKEHVDAFHKAGVYVLKHTDGLSWQILDMLIESGIDALHGIQPGIGMDVRELKRRYGDRITLFGAIDCDTLVRGTPSDIRREVEYCLRHGAPGGGFVLTSSNSIMEGSQCENYLSMLRVARGKGRYPIQL